MNRCADVRGGLCVQWKGCKNVYVWCSSCGENKLCGISQVVDAFLLYFSFFFLSEAELPATCREGVWQSPCRNVYWQLTTVWVQLRQIRTYVFKKESSSSELQEFPLMCFSTVHRQISVRWKNPKWYFLQIADSLTYLNHIYHLYDDQFHTMCVCCSGTKRRNSCSSCREKKKKVEKSQVKQMFVAGFSVWLLIRVNKGFWLAVWQTRRNEQLPRDPDCQQECESVQESGVPSFAEKKADGVFWHFCQTVSGVVFTEGLSESQWEKWQVFCRKCCH